MKNSVPERKTLQLLFSIFFLGFVFNVQAQSHWFGAGDGVSWNDPNNWDFAPGPGDDVYFLDGGNYSLFDEPFFSIGNIFIENGTIVQFQNGAPIDASSLIIQSGSLIVSGTLNVVDIDFPTDASLGSLSISPFNQLNASGNLNFDGEGSNVSIDGTLSVTGTLNSINDNGYSTLVFNSGSSATIGDWGIGQSEGLTLNDEIIDNSGGGVTIGGVVLPVELVSFTGVQTDKGIMLEWQTASELNNDFFELQRSFDGLEFKRITLINGKGYSNRLITYQYLDTKHFNSVSYYRLKQVDFDGTSSFSSILIVHVEPDFKNLIKVFPNPVKNGKLILQFSDELRNSQLIYQIISLEGGVLNTGTIAYRHEAEIHLLEKIIGNNKLVTLRVLIDKKNTFSQLIFLE